MSPNSRTGSFSTFRSSYKDPARSGPIVSAVLLWKNQNNAVEMCDIHLWGVRKMERNKEMILTLILTREFSGWSKRSITCVNWGMGWWGFSNVRTCLETQSAMNPSGCKQWLTPRHLSKEACRFGPHHRLFDAIQDHGTWPRRYQWSRGCLYPCGQQPYIIVQSSTHLSRYHRHRSCMLQQRKRLYSLL